MASRPLVSVIVAVYNGERFLASALDSIFAQDYSPLETIVVDDGSMDGTAALAQTYARVRYLHQSHQGVAAARNAGLTAAHGELIAFLDSDDIWTLDKLAIQTAYLLEHPEVDGTIGMLQNFRGSAPAAGARSAIPSRVGLMTLVARRGAFDQVGQFDAAYRVGSDMEWFSRARDAGVAIHLLPDLLVYRRVHGRNISAQMDVRKASMLRMFYQSIERKRRRA